MFHVEFITVLICIVCFSLEKFHLNLIQVDGIAYCFHVKFFSKFNFFFEMFCFSILILLFVRKNMTNVAHDSGVWLFLAEILEKKC